MALGAAGLSLRVVGARARGRARGPDRTAGGRAGASFLSDTTFHRLVGLPTDTTAARVDRWRRDLEFLLTEIRRLRPHPHEPALPRHVERLAEELYDAIPAISDKEVVTRLGRLVAALGDGHSVLYGGQRWARRSPGLSFPSSSGSFPTASTWSMPTARTPG